MQFQFWRGSYAWIPGSSLPSSVFAGVTTFCIFGPDQ